ncbi:MAG: type IV secretion system protein [Phenylobacterium sp.]|uniref:virB8 family protein n=1 Tax=Phenylobacterium sp. TaxID=1871053 RepID=UPI002734C81E|nr:type IV secretion system protein [Phenylobacterium sp.]MDP3749260.1 type IV secretion system protein [Phenylobacterium sp.]
MNQHSSDGRRAAYYAMAGDWGEDVAGGLRRSRRTAWVVASVAVVVAALEALALAALAPLKTTTPYAFVVDRQTGYVELARPLAEGQLTQDAAVTQSNLVRYVISRETFDRTDLNETYRRTLDWSSGRARADYLALMRSSNPHSPLKANGPGEQVRVVVKSVSLLPRRTALIRFETERSGPGAAASRQPFVAAVSYQYSGEPAAMAQRFDNPLGFSVSTYRRDLEVPSEVVTPVAEPAR